MNCKECNYGKLYKKYHIIRYNVWEESEVDRQYTELLKEMGISLDSAEKLNLLLQFGLKGCMFCEQTKEVTSQKHKYSETFQM